MDNALKALLRQADDDYLTGLSNKGTVKRAYKDLAQETPAVQWKEDAAEVRWKEETCVIRAPLGESTCSCPSRSVCRHVVAAILQLRQETEAEAGVRPQAAGADEEASAEASGVHAAGLTESLLQIPAERLKRACKGRRYRQFVEHLRAGELPPIEESSIVTVVLPCEQATVKLLEPFEYSTCTCHSRELCPHKAQAVLAFQILKGRLTPADLEPSEETGQTWDREQVRKTCAGICASVSHQIGTGLSRQSPESGESLERLAVISHRAELPALESLLREAASCCRQYFERSAAFRVEELFVKLLQIYGLADRLSHTESQEEFRALAGNFRDTYEPAGILHLLGMGSRSFVSGTGYEGEIYYFLEPEQKRWYTWTDARPVFYEGVRRRPPGGNAMAPWGLNCSREQLQSLEFELSNAKAASGGRLSVSKDSRGEAVGERSLCTAAVKERIFWDYEALLAEHFGTQAIERGLLNRASGRRERLVLAGALGWDESSFDSVEQRFSWNVYDRRGCRLCISMKYRKEEKQTILFLERMERRLKKRSRKAVVFFGSVYLDEDGRLCLYPIEFFIKEAEEIAEQEGLTGERSGKSADGPDAFEPPALSAEILRSMEQYCREAAEALSDLYVSGLDSVQENMLERLAALSDDGERMGLHYAGAAFSRMKEELEGRRHRIQVSSEPFFRMAGELCAYLRACRKKLSCDTALLAMKAPKEDAALSPAPPSRPAQETEEQKGMGTV